MFAQNCFNNACYKDLNWGTAYIGFNATRNNGNWICTGDGSHNGGGVIYTNVVGDIYFASIPNTGGNNQTLTDAQIKNNIKLHLTPSGVLKTKEVLVTTANWPDFVFEKDYNLPPLNEVAQFIEENQHLPNVPTAAEVETNGVNLGEMNAVLLNKIEELTLYIIDLQKQINELKQTK